MTPTAREFVGGPFDGELLAVDAVAKRVCLPVTDRNGNTLTPPRWSLYLRIDERMVWHSDGGSATFWLDKKV